MTIKLFCSICGKGEPERTNFTISKGELTCNECYIVLRPSEK
jgi:hypothetical protein